MADTARTKKYAALGEHLVALPSAENEVTLSFAQIEKIIGENLPSSAREWRQWWANQDGGSRAPHWRAAGFKVGSVDLTRERVRFRRLGTSAGALRVRTLQEVITA